MAEWWSPPAGEGDSFFAVFASAVAAVEAAGACQLALAGEAWPAGAALRVRMGLHTGEAHVHDGDRVAGTWGDVACGGSPVGDHRCVVPRQRAVTWRTGPHAVVGSDLVTSRP